MLSHLMRTVMPFHQNSQQAKNLRDQQLLLERSSSASPSLLYPTLLFRYDECRTMFYWRMLSGYCKVLQVQSDFANLMLEITPIAWRTSGLELGVCFLGQRCNYRGCRGCSCTQTFKKEEAQKVHQPHIKTLALVMM